MRTGRAGIDVDGVVFNWEKRVRQRLAQKFGVHLGQPTHWDYIKDHVSKEQWDWLWEGGLQSIFEEGEAFPQALWALEQLAKDYQVALITSCPRGAHSARLNWLNVNGAYYDELHFTGPDKRHIAADFYVEDSLDNARLLQMTGKPVYLVDRKYNRSTGDAGLIRVPDLAAVVGLLNAAPSN